MTVCVTSLPAFGVKMKARDLTQAQYNELILALKRGDAGELPRCPANECPSNIAHLLQAAAFRIEWNLASSSQEATRCISESRDKEIFAEYTCARIISANAINLYGYYGYWSTLEPLANATRRGYADGTWQKLWGKNAGTESTSPAIQDSINLQSAAIQKPHFEYKSSVKSIQVFGDGTAKSYSNGFKPRKALLNYPSAYVHVNGKRLVMLIDTGAAVSSLNASAAKRVGVSILRASGLSSTSITGVKTPTELGFVQTLSFAGLTIRDASIHVAKDNSNVAQDGILGLDVLQKFPSLTFTKEKLFFGKPPEADCKNRFTVSSNIFGDIIGLKAGGTLYNGQPAVAILDTGNATAKISPTWWAVKHFRIPVLGIKRAYAADSSGLHPIDRGEIEDRLEFLGKEYSGPMTVEANYQFGAVDFNIGMPFFYGHNLYVDFKGKRMCFFH